jgi:hypothetical protein
MLIVESVFYEAYSSLISQKLKVKTGEWKCLSLNQSFTSRIVFLSPDDWLVNAAR